ncbi:MAG: hypothetical protein ACE3JK_11955 [Sporolactobacillus sp.]
MIAILDRVQARKMGRPMIKTKVSGRKGLIITVTSGEKAVEKADELVSIFQNK